jgi:hypothetical protein
VGIAAADFVADFPEFGDASVYPVPMITYWLAFAALFLNQDRWGVPGAGGNNVRTEFDYGQELYAAHQLVLEAKAIASANNGGVPGVAEGPVNNKSVDKVSIGFDTGASSEPGAGHWNLTVYGLRFIRLLNAFGAGPIQVGLGCAPPFSGGGAWPGPWYANYPNMSG